MKIIIFVIVVVVVVVVGGGVVIRRKKIRNNCANLYILNICISCCFLLYFVIKSKIIIYFRILRPNKHNSYNETRGVGQYVKKTFLKNILTYLELSI